MGREFLGWKESAVLDQCSPDSRLRPKAGGLGAHNRTPAGLRSQARTVRNPDPWGWGRWGWFLFGTLVHTQGQGSFFLRAVERSEVKGFDMGVASRVSNATPELRFLIEGVVLEMQVFSSPGGVLRLRVEGTYRVPIGEQEIGGPGALEQAFTKTMYRTLDLDQSIYLNRADDGSYHGRAGAQGRDQLGLLFEVRELE